MSRPARVASAALGCLALAGCATPSRLSQRDQQLIAGRTYVITGASSGFGRGVAEAVGRSGANVVLAARRANLLAEVAERIETSGGKALVVPTDVSRQEDVDRLAQAALARFGRIDVWINDAAVGTIGRFEEIPVADHARVIDVNVKGVIFGSHAALRQFDSQGYGTLVNIGSVESKVPLAYHASYAASKHAILGLDEAVAQELRLGGRDRIKVVTVMPWAADTPYWQHSGNYSGRTPRMIMMDPADKVVRAITYVSIRPRKRIAVGWKAEAALVGRHIAPGLATHLAGDVTHKVQMESGPVAPPTSGSLYQPVQEGAGIDGGNRARIKAENAAAKDATPPR